MALFFAAIDSSNLEAWPRGARYREKSAVFVKLLYERFL